MPFLITPGQLTRRAGFYHQLAALTGAGVGLIPSVEQLQRHPPGTEFRQPLRRVVEALHRGATFAEAVRAGRWALPFEAALLEAAERSGRLEDCLRSLGDYHEERARMARQWLGGLAYPIFLLHFAVFLLPFSQFFATGDGVAYLRKTLGVLLPLYAVVGLGLFAAQSRHGEGWRSLWEKLLHGVPLLGTGRRALALSRLAMALEALINAGVSIVEAWPLAAQASSSPALVRVVTRWRQPLETGRTPAELVRAQGVFPEMFASQYATGEASGRLDETLRRLQRYYQDEATQKFTALAQWTPRLFYLIVAGLIAWKVMAFWLGYFDLIRRAGEF